MNPLHDEIDEEERLEAVHGAFCIECHRVRLWIANHPGASSWEIKQAIGGRTDMCLAKLIHMKMVKVTRGNDAEGKRINKWEVIPL